MNFKKFQPILEILFLSTFVYLIHKLIFFLNDDNTKFQGFHFPIETIYEFFFICSVIIIFILIKVKEKNIDNVGYTFLLVTCIKMAISYVVLSPILHSGNSNVRIEKLNFFIIFALFLTIETLVTVRILNIKQ
jgi:ABC-type transport system involved in cytochrome c biogenesis permease subunit